MRKASKSMEVTEKSRAPRPTVADRSCADGGRRALLALLGLSLYGLGVLGSAHPSNQGAWPPAAPSPGIAAETLDAASLVFEVARLRGMIVSVRGVLLCQSTTVCVFELPPPMDETISVGFDALSPRDRRRLVLMRVNKPCVSVLTGLFDGHHLRVASIGQISDDDCVPLANNPCHTGSMP